MENKSRQIGDLSSQVLEREKMLEEKDEEIIELMKEVDNFLI